MRRIQEEERERLNAKMDAEANSKEKQLLEDLNRQREQALRERKNKQAAELAARPDLSQEELAAVGLFKISLCNFEHPCLCLILQVTEFDLDFVAACSQP